jgi:hypothetical protein
VALTGGRFRDQGVIPYGNARFLGSSIDRVLAAPVVAMATAPGGAGYWMAAADGAVLAFGTARFFGSARGLNAPIVGITPTPGGGGYWLVALDGGVFAFGDAAFHGSMASRPLNAPTVGIETTPDGRGYWEVASDGGIFPFGDADFLGSMGGGHLYAPVVGMAAAPDGRGYWEVASDGGVFRFGDTGFYGSLGGQSLDSEIVGIAATPDGTGYWLGGADGSVFTFGTARFLGANATTVPTPSIAAIVTTGDGGGYWLLDSATLPANFGHEGSALGQAIVEAAATQVGGNPTPGYFCNPYGPCEEWCALFATWAWQQAGVPIPRYGFTGDIFRWAASHGTVLPPSARPEPGDAVLYGSGPSDASTSLHVGIVAQVWPDGAVVTLEGDAGPGPSGSANVVVNGPFLPGDSTAYNGLPIYAYAVPS